LVRFRRDEHGLAAVEFALLSVAMLPLFFGGIELGSALIAARKAQSVASSVADLVAQGKTINDAQLNDIFAAATALMAPYDPAQTTIVVSSIYFDPNGNQTKVRWSKATHTQALSPNTPVTLPDNILTNNSTSVIMATTTYFYKTTFGQFLTQGVTMHDTFYSRPRLSTEVTYQ
jgi:Flp pilus assembly protein TadG